MASHNDKTSVVDADSHFIINPVTRTIQNDGEKNLVQFDHNSERKTFECPRFVEGHDMLNCNRVIVNYLDNDLPGVYEVDDLTMKDTNTVMFSWLISSNATQKTGNIFFAITFMCVQTNGDVTYRWNTAINQGLKVIEGMNQNSTIVYDNVDILEQWKQQLFGTSDGEISKIQEATNECLKQIPSDYSDLNTKVDKNTTSISELKESLKDINVETDKTLTQSGKPADAEVVGKNLDDLKKNNDNLVENVPTGTCTDVIVIDLTDKSNYIQGKFVNDIPTPDTSGNEYFTDYIDCTTDDFLRIPDIVVTGATAYRLFDDSKAFLGLYWGVPRDVLKTAVKTKNENAKYIVISYDTRITTGHLTKTVYETYGKSKIAGKEFDHYGVQNTRISFVVSYNGEVSKKYSCVPGETYTFRARSNCNVYFYNPAKVFVESKSIYSSNNIEVAIEVTAPETAVYFALGGQNTTSCSLEGNFLVERCTVPKLQLTKNNFNQESFEAIAEGLGISSGKDPTELYYNCTNYGVVPGSSDNTAKFQELVDLVYEAGGGTIWIPCGTYVFDTKLSSVDLTGNITTLVEMKSGVSLLGESLTGTVLKVIGQTKDGCGLFCQNSVHSGEVLSGCNAQNFTVDMSEASLINYTHRGKAFYYSGIKNSVFRDLRLLETPSTSMGIDMLDNVVLDSIYVYKGGKQWTYGGNGGAGIGIGTGKWKNENYIIRNCICDSCGHFGIFLEDQGIFSSAKDRTYSKGQIICNNVVRNGRHYALGIRGGQNVLITGNNLYENKGGIYADYGAKNVMVSNNLIQGSTEAGFNYGNESTDYACENMAIINNTFLDNSVGIKKTLTPTNCTENGNVFINNTTNTQ